MMLKALYEYGLAHPEAVLPFGHEYKGVDYVVDLTSNGDVVTVHKPEKRLTIAPGINGKSKGTSGKSCPMIEKALISVAMDVPGTKSVPDHVQRKRNCFIGYFRDLSGTVPSCRAAFAALSDPARLARIQGLLRDAGCKPSHAVAFAVDNVPVHEDPAVREWWERTSDPDVLDCVMLDVVTGKPCHPKRVFKMLPASVFGGRATGTAFLSYHEPAFRSHGLQNGANCPMARETADTIIDVLTYLASKAPHIGDVLFLHWFDRAVPPENDPVSFIFDDLFPDSDEEQPGIDPDIAVGLADGLVKAPFLGEPPAPLLDCTYHILVVKPSNGRLSVLRYDCGTYADLYHNVASWFEDMALTSSFPGTLIRPRKLSKMLYQLLSVSEKKSNDANKFAPLNALLPYVVRSAMDAAPLPDAVLSRAIDALRTSVYDNKTESDYKRVNPLTVQWLALWVNRNPQTTKEARIMPALVSDHPNTAYHCGRLLAQYAAIQRFAEPNVKSGILTKYFYSCMQNPALVIGQIQGTSVHHLAKIKAGSYRAMFEQALSDIYQQINGDLPIATPYKDRAYFAAGYWHQQAHINGRLAELRAKKEKDNDDNPVDNEQED